MNSPREISCGKVRIEDVGNLRNIMFNSPWDYFQFSKFLSPKEK